MNVAFVSDFVVVDAAALHEVVVVVVVAAAAEVLYEQWPRTFFFAVDEREAIGFEFQNLLQLLDQSQDRRVGGELE